MDSLCRIDFEFIKFGSNSKSGEFFFFSYDQKFLLKTATPGEAQTLLHMLVDMRDRISEEPRSILGRYMGLYRLTMAGNLRLFFVMRAIPAVQNLGESRTYDLKGSTRNRRAKEIEHVGKDLNFLDEVGRLELAEAMAQQLAAIHKADLRLLRDHHIMDYSILTIIVDSNDPCKTKDARSRIKASSADKMPMVSLRGGISPAPAGTIGAMGRPGAPPPMPPLKHFTSAPMTLQVPRPGGFVGEVPTGTYGAGEAPAAKSPVSAARPSGDNPHTGIKSAGGNKTYYFGLIDLLVAYTKYPKAQFHGTQVLTCGQAEKSSRIPPRKYAERQVRMFRGICGLPRDKGDEDVFSDSSDGEASSEEDS